MIDMIKGRCLCGDVEFEIDGPLGTMSHCHCSMCRKEHGSALATYVDAPAQGYRITKGEDKIHSYKSSADRALHRSFCSTCGSVVPGKPEEGQDKVFVPAGLLEGDVDVKPAAHIFVASKAGWYEITDGLPQFDAYPPGYGEAVETKRHTEPHEGAVEGSCLCGAVTFEYTGTPEFMMNCHCSRCRRTKGAAHASNVFVKSENFAWTKGEEHVVNYKLPEAKSFGHAFCDTCGSSLPRFSPGTGFMNIPAGALDDDPGIRPRGHIFVGSKASWFEPSDDLPKFEEMPTG
jgi:hypothetical protein